MSCAIVLAGGESESQRVGDEYVPRLMLPLGDKPLLQHHLEWLKGGGIDSVVLCLEVRAEKVRSYFGDGSAFGVKLRYLVEESPLGSAGAVKALGAASLPDDILVLGADAYYGRCPLRRFLDFHASHQALATIAVGVAEPEPRGRGKARPKAAGPAAASAPAGSHGVLLGPGRLIVEIQDRPAPAGSLAALRLWGIRRAVLRFSPDEGPSDFLRDVFPAALRAGESLQGWPEAGIVDLGTGERYEAFARGFRG